MRSPIDSDLRHLMACSIDGILITSPDGTIHFANEAACELLGRSEDEIRALGRDGLVDHSDPELARLLETRAREGRVRGALRYLKPDGTAIPCEMSSSVYTREDGEVRTIIVLRDIGEAKRAEARLRQSEERFRSMTELSSDFYWETDADHRIRQTEHTARHLPVTVWGSLYGKTRWEIPSTSPGAEGWAAHRRTLESRAQFRNFEFSRLDVQGVERFLSISGQPTFDDKGAFTGYRGIGHDITELKQIDRKLRESETRFRAIFEYASAGILVWALDGTLLSVNEAYADFLGYSVAELVGRNIALTQPPEEMDEAKARRTSLLASLSSTIHGERQYVCKDGRRVWGRIAMTVVRDAQGAPEFFISVVVDITEERAAKAQIEELNAELEARVAARTAELEGFMYSISHDFKAPIRAISSFASLLRDDLAPAPQTAASKYLDRIVTNSSRMASLLEDLLDLSRFSTQELAKQELDMGAEVAAVVAELSGEAPRARFETGALPPCLGDASLIRQVWINLISNAIKYSAQAAEPLIRIGFENGAYFVADNGAGFDMAYSGKLFKLFSRLHAEQDYGGTGVGLAIVRRIVERHGGQVEAAGGVGTGARFSFTLAS